MLKKLTLFFILIMMLSCTNKGHFKSAPLIEIDDSEFSQIISNETKEIQNWFFSIFNSFENPKIAKIKIDIKEVDTLKVILDNNAKENSTLLIFGAGFCVPTMEDNNSSSIDLQIGVYNQFFDYNYKYRLTKEDDKITFSWLNDTIPAKEPVESSELFVPNQIFPVFKTQTIDNEEFDLKDVEGKPIVINWWHIGCSNCRKEIPELNKVFEKYKEKINFIAISGDMDIENLKEFLNRTDFRYRHLQSNAQLRNIFPGKYPYHIIINKEGQVIYSKCGLKTFAELDKILGNL